MTATGRLGTPLAGALVFVTSGAVLVLEILAGRLLAPYVGVTLETYTGIIGTVLAGIALGTWLGGVLADRLDPARLLGPAIVLGGALALLTVPVVRALGAGWQGGRVETIVVLSVVGFLAPAVVLSTVTPLAIKLELRHLAETGHVVGRLSALGTAGAIAGTFLAGFVLIGLAATSTLIPAIGLVLVAIGVATWLRTSRADGTTMSTFVAVAAAGLGITALAGGQCDVETEYYCARVEIDADRPTGRVLVLDDLRHSYVDLEDPAHLEFGYIRAFASVIEAARPAGPVEVLHVGGGGFTMPRWLRATRPGSASTVLELDRGVVALAEERLALERGPDLDVVTGDARLSLGRLDAGRFDVVLGDAFGGVAVPWHLTTREVAAEVRRVLRPAGVYAVNVIDRGGLRFAAAFVATVDEVFEHVVVLGSGSALAGRGGNLVVVASGEPIDRDAIAAGLAHRGTDQIVVAGSRLDELLGGGRVLTDDHAPVDQLITAPDRVR